MAISITSYLSDHKSHIVYAIFGALVTGCISMATAYYNMSKTFKLSQKKDYHYQLKVDINLLQRTSKELDSTISLLLSKNMALKVEFERYSPSTINEHSPITGNDLKEINNKNVNLQIYKVTKVLMPEERFFINSWPLTGPQVSEINFDLIDQLNDLFIKLFKINEDIDEVWSLLIRERIGYLFYQKIKTLEKKVNENISDISSEKLVELKDKIRDEIDILQQKINY